MRQGDMQLFPKSHRKTQQFTSSHYSLNAHGFDIRLRNIMSIRADFARF